MKLDLSKQYDTEKAQSRLHELIKKEAVIELTEKHPPKSWDQLKLYWVWLTIISLEAGFEKEELHYMYRGMYLQRDRDYITKIIYPELWDRMKSKLDNFVHIDNIGIVIDIISQSTTELDISEMTAYMDKIKQHVRENYNLELKSINEPGWDDFLREYRKYV